MKIYSTDDELAVGAVFMSPVSIASIWDSLLDVQRNKNKGHLNIESYSLLPFAMFVAHGLNSKRRNGLSIEWWNGYHFQIPKDSSHKYWL